MNTSDYVPVLAALAAMMAFAITLAVLYRLRVSAGKAEAQASRVTDAERVAANERRRREAELEKAVAAGTHLADGRPRCQASLTCMEPASRAKPRVLRDEGIVDFIRRAFGAPRRYRMVEPNVSEQPAGLFGAFYAFFRALWLGETKEAASIPLRYCDVHIHIARQVCLEQLSSDEHAESSAQTEREKKLAVFESQGMEKRVQKLISETELQESDKKRRKSPEADKTNVLPFGRAANGSSSSVGPS